MKRKDKEQFIRKRPKQNILKLILKNLKIVLEISKVLKEIHKLFW